MQHCRSSVFLDCRGRCTNGVIELFSAVAAGVVACQQGPSCLFARNIVPRLPRRNNITHSFTTYSNQITASQAAADLISFITSFFLFYFQLQILFKFRFRFERLTRPASSGRRERMWEHSRSSAAFTVSAWRHLCTSVTACLRISSCWLTRSAPITILLGNY